MKKQSFNFDVEGLRLPIECMKAMAEVISDSTQKLVKGNVEEYDGEVYSRYDPSGSISEAFINLNKGKIIFNIQDELGAVAGSGETKLEFYLTAEELKDYKCRLFFVEHGLGGYPARVILESGIADEINGKENEGYIFTCDNMGIFEDLLSKIISSQYVHEILQSIITESLVRKSNRAGMAKPKTRKKGQENNTKTLF